MHLIIKNKYLKKIKNFVSIFCDFSKKKQEGAILKCSSEYLSIYVSSEVFNLKIDLEKGENLSIKKEGEATINIKFLDQLFESIERNNDLEIYKAEKNLLQFFSGKFTCNLRLIEKELEIDEEFNVKESENIPIDYQTFKNFFTRLKDFCKSSESNINTNTVLTNINISNNFEEENIEAWSSDSYRVVYGKNKFICPREFSMNISPQMMNVILGIFSDYSSENINFWIKDDVLIVKKNEYSFKTRLNLNKYPEFIQWFNEKERFRFSLNKDELICAIDRNLLLSDNNMKTTFYRIEDKKMFIEYKDNERGFCEELIEIDDEVGEKIEFSLNSFLLKSLLKMVSSKKVIFSISNPFKPIVILSNDETDQFKQFILPLNNA